MKTISLPLFTISFALFLSTSSMADLTSCVGKRGNSYKECVDRFTSIPSDVIEWFSEAPTKSDLSLRRDLIVEMVNLDRGSWACARALLSRGRRKYEELFTALLQTERCLTLLENTFKSVRIPDYTVVILCELNLYITPLYQWVCEDLLGLGVVLPYRKQAPPKHRTLPDNTRQEL